MSEINELKIALKASISRETQANKDWSKAAMEWAKEGQQLKASDQRLREALEHILESTDNSYLIMVVEEALEGKDE